MIVYQVKDIAAATCGQPLIAEDSNQASLAVGRLLSSDPDLGSRASKIRLEILGLWNGVDGFDPRLVDAPYSITGTKCVEFWTAAVAEAAEADSRCDPYVNPKMKEVVDDE